MDATQENHMKGEATIDKIVASVGIVTRWMCLLLVLLQFAVVVARYIFDTGSVMAQEAILYVFGTMFMLTLADALQNDRHVRVDMLYHNYDGAKRRLVDGIGIVLFFFPLCGYILYVSWSYVLNSWAVFEGSREAAGLPGVYLFKTVIIVSFVLVVLQALVILFRCFGKGGQNNA